MERLVFVNLACRDIARAREFYLGLGFTLNPQFSDAETLCVVVSETIFFMVMTEAKFQGFAPRPLADTRTSTAALVALSAASRAEVDGFARAALAHGGSDNDRTQDLGFMYARSLSDPDGNVIEFVWMDLEAASAAMAARP